jgi:RNA polymerase sigma factor
MSVASRVSGSYVRLGEDDLSTVALLALDEAARSFRPELGVFPAFAREVIRRRTIDYIRRQARNGRELLAGFMAAGPDQDEDDRAGRATGVQMAVRELAAREHYESQLRQHEVLAFTDELRAFGVTMSDLLHSAPTHRDARDNCQQVARVLSEDPGMREYLRQRKQLPLRELAERARLGRKSLERHRKYIIALALILMGDYEYLAGYMQPPDQVGE